MGLLAGGRDPLADLAGVYARFAAWEAHSRSTLNEELAPGISGDREVLRLLAALPLPKQQPSLVLAAARLVGGTPDGWAGFRANMRERRDEIVPVILARRTQTNKPARCATLLPLVATLPQPLALVEVGESAGQCLLPTATPTPTAATTSRRRDPPPYRPDPRLPRERVDPAPCPKLEVGWRSGLDLEPIDVRDAEQAAWLRGVGLAR